MNNPEDDGLHQLVGRSASIAQLHADVRQAGRSDAKVLVTGESGSGKEVVARLIHSYSRRGARSFCAVNCGGIADTLLESELFGHSRGSFTGAYRDKIGLVEQAHGGTLFLDEVGEMSLRMQAALLRFLENGEIQPVGGDRHGSRLDVRVIAATNRDLLENITAGSFRADLYYRLNVIHLVVPPLRARRDDIEALVHHFVRRLAPQHREPTETLTTETIAALTRHDWPGNVRELRNVVERILVHGSTAALRSEGIQKVALHSPASESIGVCAGAAEGTRPGSRSAALFGRLVNDGESFWTAVYKPFIQRDLTRADVREVVAAGLERTRGNYKMLVPLFNMESKDYKRFLQFLHTHRCFTPFEHFRSSLPPSDLSPAPAPLAAQPWAAPSSSAVLPSL